MGRGDVPGLAWKSRPEHLPSRQKTCRHCLEENRGQCLKLGLKRTDHVCVCKLESVCTPVLLHIEA